MCWFYNYVGVWIEQLCMSKHYYLLKCTLCSVLATLRWRASNVYVLACVLARMEGKKCVPVDSFFAATTYNQDFLKCNSWNVTSGLSNQYRYHHASLREQGYNTTNKNKNTVLVQFITQLQCCTVSEQ